MTKSAMVSQQRLTSGFSNFSNSNAFDQDAFQSDNDSYSSEFKPQKITSKKLNKLSAADVFFLRGMESKRSHDNDVFGGDDDDDATWATEQIEGDEMDNSIHSKRSTMSTVEPKRSKITDDDVDWFSEVESDTEGAAPKKDKVKKAKKDRKHKESKEKEKKDSKRSSDKDRKISHKSKRTEKEESSRKADKVPVSETASTAKRLSGEKSSENSTRSKRTSGDDTEKSSRSRRTACVDTEGSTRSKRTISADKDEERLSQRCASGEDAERSCRSRRTACVDAEGSTRSKRTISVDKDEEFRSKRCTSGEENEKSYRSRRTACLDPDGSTRSKRTISGDKDEEIRSKRCTSREETEKSCRSRRTACLDPEGSTRSKRTVVTDDDEEIPPKRSVPSGKERINSGSQKESASRSRRVSEETNEKEAKIKDKASKKSSKNTIDEETKEKDVSVRSKRTIQGDMEKEAGRLNPTSPTIEKKREPCRPKPINQTNDNEKAKEVRKATLINHGSEKEKQSNLTKEGLSCRRADPDGDHADLLIASSRNNAEFFGSKKETGLKSGAKISREALVIERVSTAPKPMALSSVISSQKESNHSKSGAKSLSAFEMTSVKTPTRRKKKVVSCDVATQGSNNSNESSTQSFHSWSDEELQKHYADGTSRLATEKNMSKNGAISSKLASSRSKIDPEPTRTQVTGTNDERLMELARQEARKKIASGVNHKGPIRIKVKVGVTKDGPNAQGKLVATSTIVSADKKKKSLSGEKEVLHDSYAPHGNDKRVFERVQHNRSEPTSSSQPVRQRQLVHAEGDEHSSPTRKSFGLASFGKRLIRNQNQN